MNVYRIAYCLPGLGEDYRDVEATDTEDAFVILSEYLVDTTGRAPEPLGPRHPNARVLSLREVK